MKTVTLCYCLNGPRILLGMKKTGFGAGKYNGFGGKVKECESIPQATVRELGEESGVRANEIDLDKVAEIEFSFEGQPKFHCHVFLLKIWNGKPVETEEMSVEWFGKNTLPLDRMWVADRYWLPRVLAGEKLMVEVNFNKTGDEILEISMTEIAFD